MKKQKHYYEQLFLVKFKSSSFQEFLFRKFTINEKKKIVNFPYLHELKEHESLINLIEQFREDIKKHDEDERKIRIAYRKQQSEKIKRIFRNPLTYVGIILFVFILSLGGYELYQNYDQEVSLNLNGGEYEEFWEFNDESYKNKYGNQEIPIPSQEGYKFQGWYLNPNFEGDVITHISPELRLNGEINLYAKWKVIQYAIQFDTQGGSYIDSISEDFNTEISSPASPFREGYTFLGWYLDIEYLEPYSFSTMPAESLTLYAKWVLNTYTIKFMMLDETIVTTLKFGEQIEFPAISNEFHFEGWFYDSNMTSTFNLKYMPSNNIIIYAKLIYKEIVKNNDSLFEIYFETVNNNYFAYSNNELMLLDMNFRILKTFDISDYSDQLPTKNDAIKSDEFIFFFTRLCNPEWPEDSSCGDGDVRYLLKFDHNLNLIDTFNYWREGTHIDQYQIIDFTMDESYSKIYFLEVRTRNDWVCRGCYYKFLGRSLTLFEYNLSGGGANYLDTIIPLPSLDTEPVNSNLIFEHKIAFHKDYLLIVSNNLIMKYTFDGTLIRSESIAGDNNGYPVKAEIYKEKYLILITGVSQRYNAKLRIFELDNLSLIHSFTDIVSYTINQDLLYLLSKQGKIYNVDDSFNLLELISIAGKISISNSYSDFNVNFFIDSYQTFVLSAYQHSYKNIKVYIQSKSSKLSVRGSNPF